MASCNDSSPVKINDDGNCDFCSTIVPEKEIILCSVCKDRFHATCKSAKNKICSITLLNNFMNGNTRDNFMWFCDPCLISFRADQGTNKSNRLVTLEKNYEDIASQLNEIKSLFSKEPAISTMPTPTVSSSTNPWMNCTKVRIMKNNLNGEKANVVLLEDKLSPEISQNLVSTDLKDGSTIFSCTSAEDAAALEGIVKQSFPDHNVTLKKPSKSIIRIVGFKSEYTSDQFFSHLFSRNPSLSSFNKSEHFDLLSIKPCLKDASTF